MPSASELIAHGRTVEEVCQLIGADWLVYQDLDDLVRCSLEGNPGIEGLIARCSTVSILPAMLTRITLIGWNRYAMMTPRASSARHYRLMAHWSVSTMT